MDNIFRLFVVSPIFTSSQATRSEIISFNNGICELPHELPQDLRLRNWGYYEIVGKCLNFKEWLPGAQSSCQNKTFVSINKKVLKKKQLNFSRVVLFHIETKVSLRYFITACVWKTFFDSNSSSTPPTLFPFRMFLNLGLLTLF